MQRPLSIERLAEMVHVTKGTVSNWETDKRRIRVEDRRLLLLLISVLYTHGGIKSLDEANALLQAGGYRALDDDEREQARLERDLQVADGHAKAPVPLLRRVAAVDEMVAAGDEGCTVREQEAGERRHLFDRAESPQRVHGRNSRQRIG